MSWLNPQEESKYGSSWFENPIVQDQPEIYRYNLPSGTGDKEESSDEEYEDDFESDSDFDVFENKEKEYAISINRTRTNILEQQKN